MGYPHRVYSATLYIRTTSRSVPKDIVSDAGVEFRETVFEDAEQKERGKAAHGLDGTAQWTAPTAEPSRPIKHGAS